MESDSSATDSFSMSASRTLAAHSDAHHDRPIAGRAGAADFPKGGRAGGTLGRARFGVEAPKPREQERIQGRRVDPQGPSTEQPQPCAGQAVSERDAADADERAVFVAAGVP